MGPLQRADVTIYPHENDINYRFSPVLGAA
jgi:hypothetical protein